MWRVRLLPLACDEPMRALFEEGSCSSSALEEYTTQLVWLLTNSTAVVAWELMNEMDLQAGIGHPSGNGGGNMHHQHQQVQRSRRLNNCFWYVPERAKISESQSAI